MDLNFGQQTSLQTKQTMAKIHSLTNQYSISTFTYIMYICFAHYTEVLINVHMLNKILWGFRWC